VVLAVQVLAMQPRRTPAAAALAARMFASEFFLRAPAIHGLLERAEQAAPQALLASLAEPERPDACLLLPISNRRHFFLALVQGI
jgi:hypothetical protein